MTQVFQDMMRYSNFLRELVAKDFKSKYYKSVLGVVWTILNPLLMMAVMTVVFSTLFRRNIPYFPVYYLGGWVLFNFNSEATNQGLHAVVANSNLIKKIRVPSYHFVISKVILAFINKLFSLVPLFLVIVVLRMPVPKTIFLMPIPMLLTFFFSMGVALALSAMAVYFRDLFHLYSIVMMLWMYLTPMFYPIEIIPESIRFLWNYNPMFHYVTMMRGFVIYGTLPTLETVIYSVCFSVLSMAAGILVYHKLEPNFMLHM